MWESLYQNFDKHIIFILESKSMVGQANFPHRHCRLRSLCTHKHMSWMRTLIGWMQDRSRLSLNLPYSRRYWSGGSFHLRACTKKTKNILGALCFRMKLFDIVSLTAKPGAPTILIFLSYVMVHVPAAISSIFVGCKVKSFHDFYLERKYTNSLMRKMFTPNTHWNNMFINMYNIFTFN